MQGIVTSAGESQFPAGIFAIAERANRETLVAIVSLTGTARDGYGVQQVDHAIESIPV
jgi:hypothetical protein